MWTVGTDKGGWNCWRKEMMHFSESVLTTSGACVHWILPKAFLLSEWFVRKTDAKSEIDSWPSNLPVFLRTNATLRGSWLNKTELLFNKKALQFTAKLATVKGHPPASGRNPRPVNVKSPQEGAGGGVTGRGLLLLPLLLAKKKCLPARRPTAKRFTTVQFPSQLRLAPARNTHSPDAAERRGSFAPLFRGRYFIFATIFTENSGARNFLPFSKKWHNRIFCWLAGHRGEWWWWMWWDVRKKVNRAWEVRWGDVCVVWNVRAGRGWK